MDHHPHVSVEEQDSPADQIRDAWHISNESQLQSYVQREPRQFLQILNNLRWERDSNDHLDFKTYLDLLSFLDKYYQNHLQGKTDMKEWEALHMKHDDQFPVFWMEFTTLAHKIEALFNNMPEQSLDLLVHQLRRKLSS